MNAATATMEPAPVDVDASDRPDDERPASRGNVSRRRFIIASVVGTLIALPFNLWLSWDTWSGSLNPLRAVSPDDFYDLQARAMFHGHLYVPNGLMGIEAFNHDGHQFTYFGIFPSLVRMPILIFTSRLDMQLTGPMILAAWVLTAVFSSLLLWRLRIMIRGTDVLGRAEAAAFGALMTTILGGSVVLYLSAIPYVFNEDFAWSVGLTIGSLFALLGVMERPSWGRVAASAVLITFTNLDRTPTGYACVIGAGLVALWFYFGRGGRENRRWTIPMLAIGGFAFLLSCAVTYGKFGIPVGLPMADQAWTAVNAWRRHFLAANGGKAFSLHFLPSTLWAYLQPFGIHLSGLFPFISTPTAPAAPLAGAVLEWTYPTGSIPATMPLLFLLSCWGLVTAFRPHAAAALRVTRVLLLTAGAGAAGVLLWGYIAERYMADFMPLLVLAAGIGLIDLWRRLATRPRRHRKRWLVVIVVVALYCLAANVAIAVGPVQQWTMAQTKQFVTVEQKLSLQSLGATVRKGNSLPYWAPTGTLFATNGCTGLYMSSGINLDDVPGQRVEHLTLMPVEQSPSYSHTIGFVFNRSGLNHDVPIMTYGKSTLVIHPTTPGFADLLVENSGTSISWPPPSGHHFPSTLLHEQYRITVTVDPNLNQLTVYWYGTIMFAHYIAGNGPARVLATPSSTNPSTPTVTVYDVPTPSQADPMRLCRSLVQGN